ncbi:MAG TPA: hypothetical protein VGP82_18160 [Ktedonobacterales bacterium]|jgi:hypothetical protein|nr:hypothetical protein [Ktedonobacterales bacterium]
MSYAFAGFFAQAEPSVLKDALATWPGCQGRIITEPFQGIGVAVPEQALTYGRPAHVGERATALAYALEEELVAWSRGYPATRFVFMRARCIGGPCRYWGYVCQDGAIQARATDSVMGHGDALQRLVRALGVELDQESGDFAPFTRGYFNPAP